MQQRQQQKGLSFFLLTFFFFATVGFLFLFLFFLPPYLFSSTSIKSLFLSFSQPLPLPHIFFEYNGRVDGHTQNGTRKEKKEEDARLEWTSLIGEGRRERVFCLANFHSQREVRGRKKKKTFFYAPAANFRILLSRGEMPGYHVGITSHQFSSFLFFNPHSEGERETHTQTQMDTTDSFTLSGRLRWHHPSSSFSSSKCMRCGGGRERRNRIASDRLMISLVLQIHTCLSLSLSLSLPYAACCGNVTTAIAVD